MASTSRLEVNTSSYVCRLCGTAYGGNRGFFYASYGQIYKGTGFMTTCKTCVDNLYEDFLRECGDARTACHAVCRKFNIFWDDKVFDGVVLGSSHRTVMAGYLQKINVVKFRGKSYDDYLREVGMLWDIPHIVEEEPAPPPEEEQEPEVDESEPEEEIEVSDEVRIEWGPGFSNKQYHELDERRKYWVEELKKRNINVDDINVMALLRQIVGVELEINRRRANGEDVSKLVNTFQSLVGDALLKPSMKKSDADIAIDNTTLGSWIQKFENERPLPECENESVLKKFVHTWMFGHLAKMVGLKNSYCQMYEDEIQRLRVEMPEYADDDDDALITAAFSEEVFDDG